MLAVTSPAGHESASSSNPFRRYNPRRGFGLDTVRVWLAKSREPTSSRRTYMSSHVHDHPSRRRFLWRSVTAAVAGFVTGTARAVRGQSATPEARSTKDLLAYGQPSSFDTTIRRAPGPATPITDTALTTPLQDLDGIITPSGLHFLMDHVNGVPDIDPRQHRLMMHGMVDRPLTFTMDEVRRFPSVSRIYFLECNANSRPLRGPNGDSVQLVHGRPS